MAVITETHLDQSVADEQICQKGYQLLRRDRHFLAVNKSKGGGIIMYLRDGLHHTEPDVCVPDELEVVWCILRPSQPDSIIVAGVYIPPDASAHQRSALSDHLVQTLDKLRSNRPKARTVLLGDFNSTFDVKSLAQQLGLQQIVTEPTRGIAILDMILTDFW